MRFKYNDGGRTASGRKGDTFDCVCRALAIATGKPYLEIYSRLADGNATQKTSKHSILRSGHKMRTASRGIFTNRKWFADYMTELGFEWIACMTIGSGCQVHLRENELPAGRIVCKLSRHLCAVIDREINDTFDPSRAGQRCIYGYWKLADSL